MTARTVLSHCHRDRPRWRLVMATSSHSTLWRRTGAVIKAFGAGDRIVMVIPPLENAK